MATVRPLLSVYCPRLQQTQSLFYCKYYAHMGNSVSLSPADHTQARMRALAQCTNGYDEHMTHTAGAPFSRCDLRKETGAMVTLFLTTYRCI